MRRPRRHQPKPADRLIIVAWVVVALAVVLFIAWKTGPACGFTATRSCGRRISKYNAAMMEITEAQEA